MKVDLPTPCSEEIKKGLFSDSYEINKKNINIIFNPTINLIMLLFCNDVLITLI